MGMTPKYKTAAELEKVIEQYWVSARKDNEPYMITRLSQFLGFASRQSIYDYAKKGEFSYSIKRALLNIEAQAELALIKGGGAAEIFRLKNFGWKDTQHTDLTTDGKGLSALSNDELIERINRIAAKFEETETK